MDKEDKMLMDRTNEEKRNIIKSWKAYAEILPEDGQEIMQDRIDWLESTIVEKKKKKKKKKKAKKKKEKK